jgi:hypothetical protein
MGGNGGKPKPGGAQIIKGKGMGGATQVQPAFASVTSVTPGEIAVNSEGTSPADGIALGPDGDPHAPIPNPPNTTNKEHARLNTVDMLVIVTSEQRTVAGHSAGRLFWIAHSLARRAVPETGRGPLREY